MKIKSLPPVSYSTSKDYFTEFFRINKIRNLGFSYRAFAEELEWPASYLPDLVSGRKKLSVQRALQFSEYFKLNNVDKEHLLWLAISRQTPRSDATSSALSLRTNPNSRLYPGSAGEEIFLKNDIIWVTRFLLWRRKRMSAVELHQEFEVSSVSIARIEKALAAIAEHHLLVWNSDGSLKSENATLLDEFDHSDTKGDKAFEGIELHRDPTLNFLKFIENPQAPSTYHTRVIAVPKGQFMQIAIKLIDLRNWIDEISKEHLKESKDPEKTSHLMQLDLNLFPLKKKKL